MIVSAPPRPTVTAYSHGQGVYLNMTNRCPTTCTFCVKRPARWNFEGSDLRLAGQEPSAAQVMEAAEPFLVTGRYEELVFCGYGESTYRLPAMLSVGRETARRFPSVRRRLNTVGLGNLIWGRDIISDLKLCVDAVSVSVNTADRAQWRTLHAPHEEFADDGYAAVLRFVSGCVRSGLETTVTAVQLPDVDLAAVETLAHDLGASFRLRPPLSPELTRGG